MRNLLNFLARYNNLIIFLFLEGLAIYLLLTGNSYHNSRVVNSLNSITYGVETKISNTRNYLHLREINEDLAAENIALRNRIGRLVKSVDTPFALITDTIYNQQYYYTSGEIVNNSINRQKNFFTINKGKRHGITTDMAVICGDGVAGVIIGCSENYSVAMPVLNPNFKLSARIKRNGYFGSLGWDGRDYRYALLSEIPQHVSVIIGDTIETTGYSAIFPEGVMVGTVADFEKKGGDFYAIKVKLKTDFNTLHFVNIIGNLKKTEQHGLEKLFQ
ncbi:MAG TPA: rod shape-determining protein MreC [Bacteroidales bacterium]|nr:rod shape-determining protein MreC [Bacteroidales bacterium]